MTTPLFSVCIPCYNYGNKISATIASVLKQQSAFEIIVVDDGSSDNTAEVMQQLQAQHPGVIQFIQQTNQGPSAARNNAIKQARGQFILCLDADDQLTDNALQIFATAIEQHPNISLFISQHRSISNNKVKIRRKPAMSQHTAQNFVNYLRGKFTLAHGAHVVRRDVFNSLSYPEDIRGREDIVFFAQALATCPALSIQEPTVEVHKHSSSLRHQLDKHHGSLVLSDRLFDPAILPSDCMKYKKEFASRLCLSLFRDHFVAGNIKEAKQWYHNAICLQPSAIFQWKYLKKRLRCLFTKLV